MTHSAEPNTLPAAQRLRRSLPVRLKAAGIHLGLSAVAFAVALYLILVRWYPGFHFGVDGGWQGVRLMAFVDLVLGPMLTLIIFSPFKARRLIVLDLACIGIMQAAALTWGFYAVHGQRPVSLNLHDGVFYSMPLRSVRASPGAAEALARLSDRQPALIYVAPPRDADEARRAANPALLAHENALFFRDFASHWEEAQGAVVDPASTHDAAFRQALPEFLARHGGVAADYRFFRYQGGYGSCILAFTPRGKPVDALACEHA